MLAARELVSQVQFVIASVFLMWSELLSVALMTVLIQGYGNRLWTVTSDR